MLMFSHFGTPPPPQKKCPPPGHSRICPCLIHTIPLQHYYYSVEPDIDVEPYLLEYSQSAH